MISCTDLLFLAVCLEVKKVNFVVSEGEEGEAHWLKCTLGFHRTFFWATVQEQ